MKRTKRTKPQMTLALPLDPAAPNAELEAAVQAAEASFLAKATDALKDAGQSEANPSTAEPAATRQPAKSGKTVEFVDDARSGRNTLYVVAAVKWGEVRVKRGTRQGWQRLPDVAFKNKQQALRAAELMVEAGRATGAVAIKQTADTDLGDYEEPVILSRFGTMPEEFLAA